MATETRHYVYVSGNLTTDKKFLQNIGNALDAATALLKLGYAVYVPHLNYFWEAQAASSIQWDNDYRVWITMDYAWIDKCDAILRLPGASNGGDKEVAYAGRNNIPVFYSIEDLKDHFDRIDSLDDTEERDD